MRLLKKISTFAKNSQTQGCQNLLTSAALSKEKLNKI